MLSIVYLALTCAGNEETVTSTQTADSAGVRITTINAQPSTVREWAVSPNSMVTLTGAHTGDSSAFAAVGSVRWLSDGRIVVADVAASRLLVFDSSGKYLRPLGRQGSGPGEFRRLGSVTV
ncbi:MAG: 6-bladed beta-propeller, partial [Gemmatimonadaceae bacterium]